MNGDAPNSDGFVMRGERKVERGQTQWNFTDKVTADVPFVGPYELLQAQRPLRGTSLPEFPTLVVVGSDLQEGDGGTGTLTVHLELPFADDSNVTFDPIAEPEWEIAFNEGRAAIWLHPKCGFLDERAGPRNLHIDDWEALAANADVYKKRVAAPPKFPKDGWTLAQYIELRQLGRDDYLVREPVISRTLIYLRKPTEVGEGCFTRQHPPIGASFPEVEKYDWLRGSDVASKAGKVWRRTTRWMGSDWRVIPGSPPKLSGWDEKIYDDFPT